MDQGGLNYKLDVSGNLQAALEAIEKRIDSISAKAKSLKVAPQGSPNRTASALAETEGEVLLTKKLQSLENQIYLSRQRAVSLKRAELALSQKAEAVARRISTEEGRQLTNMQRRVVFDKERIRSAQQLNKQLTQAQDNKGLQQASALKADMLKRDKERQKLETDTVKNQERIAKEQKRISDYNNVGLQATNRNAEAARELAIKKAQILELTKAGTMSQRQAAEQVGITSAQAKQLKLNMWDTEHAARQFLFTFRRLVGILAIFTAARKLAQALAAGVKEMITFNQKLEIAEIGMASLAMSVGRVYDAQGNLLTGQAAFNEALKASSSLVRQLRVDAVGSIATFENLVETMQVAIGPGLSAGMDLDEIRIVTRRLIEAATEMGIPTAMIAQQVRMLLQGTTRQQTRIAALFGGPTEANRMVKQAREAGNLYQVLSKRLEGVSLGADMATSSMTVLRSNLQDAVQLLLADGGINYFEAMKEAVLGLTRAIATIDAEGSLDFNPEALGVVQEVSNALTGIIKSFRELTDTQANFNLLKNVLASLADTLAILAPAAITVFQGVLTGVNSVLKPLSEVLRFFKALLGIDAFKNVGKGALAALRIMSALVGISFTFLAISRLAAAVWGAKGVLGAITRVGDLFASLIIKQATVLAAQTGIVAGTAAWNLLLVGVVVKMALITGGATLIVGFLATLITRTQAWQQLMAKVTPAVKGTRKEMGVLGTNIRGTLQDIGDLRSEFKNIEESVKKLNEEVMIEKALAGVSDSARAILELYAKRKVALDDITKIEREGIVVAQKKLDIIRAQKDALIEYYEANKEQRDSGFSGRVEAQKIKLLAEESKQLVRIKQLEQDREEKIKGSDALFEAQVDAEQAKYEILQKNRSVQIETIEAQAAASAEQEQARGQAFADLVIAKSKLAVLKEQQAVQKDTAEVTQTGLDDAISQQQSIIQAAGVAEARLLEARKELEAIKPVELGASINVDELKKELLGLRLQARVGLSKDEITAQSLRRKEIEGQIASLQSDATQENIKAAKESYDLQIAAARARVDAAEIDASKSAETAAKALKSIELLNARKEQERVRALVAEVNQKKEEVRLQRELTKIQLEASDKFISGVQLGLIQFKEAVGTFPSQIAEITIGALTDLSGTVASVFKDAIDPRKDADLRTAFGEFFLNLAGDFVQAITQQLLAQAVGSLLGGGANVAADSALIASQTSLTAATTALTAAMTGDIAATSVNTAATTTDAAATTANTGATFLNTIATNLNSLWLKIKAALPFSTGGLVGGYAKGGHIKGYAVGGDIPRPSHIPASDTVPAWLTPGEFVIRRAAVQKYGTGLMDMINRGRLPASFHEAGHSLRRTTSAVQHFASGGNVSPASVTSSPERTTQTIVLPVMPANDTTVDQMLTGGRKAFDRKVNQSPRIGDANATKRW
jgi:hypothetical protein